MAAVTKDLYIEQGATFTMSFSWHESVNTGGVITPGPAHDITDHTVRMQIRKAHGQPILVEASTDNGKITLDGPNGRITVKLTDEDTDTLSVKSAQYDLEIETPTGDVTRLLQGGVTISLSITREG